MNNKVILKLTVLGFFFISIIGTLSHFVYEWSGYNKIIGAFFPVNESVWEHMKMAVIPSFLWLVIEYSITKKFFPKAKLVSLLTTMITIPLLYYIYMLFLNKENVIIDIIIFYLAIGFGQYVFYRITKKCVNNKSTNNTSIILLSLIFISFVLFTYITPKLDIFKDKNNNTYSIYKTK